MGGFDPIFWKAGDDVDLAGGCNRRVTRSASAPAFVWHYRRSTIGAYLKQQRGYGESEALLVRETSGVFQRIRQQHVARTDLCGVEIRPDAEARTDHLSRRVRQRPFQTLYTAQPALTLMLPTTLALPHFHHAAAVGAVGHVPLAAAGGQCEPVDPLVFCAAGWNQATLQKSKRRWWSRPLVTLLFFLQPIVRGWEAPSKGASLASRPRYDTREPGFRHAPRQHEPLDEVRYWAESRIERVDFVAKVLRALEQRGWPNRSDIGWSEFDAEIFGNRWTPSSSSPPPRIIRAAATHPWPPVRPLVHAGPAALWLLLALESSWLDFFGGWLWALVVADAASWAYFLSRQKRQIQSQFITLPRRTGQNLETYQDSQQPDG